MWRGKIDVDLRTTRKIYTVDFSGPIKSLIVYTCLTP